MCSTMLEGGGGRQWGSGVGGKQRVSHCLEVLQVSFNLSLLLILSYNYKEMQHLLPKGAFKCHCIYRKIHCLIACIFASLA